MENKAERSVNLIALLLVVAFTVLSCFTCFEFYSTIGKMPIVDDVRESITPVGYIVIALSVVNMLVQIISLKKKKEGNEP